jgi:hypothetical protein
MAVPSTVVVINLVAVVVTSTVVIVKDKSRPNSVAFSHVYPSSPAQQGVALSPELQQGLVVKTW